MWRSRNNKKRREAAPVGNGRVPPAGACDVDVEWIARLRSAHCLQVAIDRGNSNKAMAVPLDPRMEWFLFSKGFCRLNHPSPIYASAALLLKRAAMA